MLIVCAGLLILRIVYVGRFGSIVYVEQPGVLVADAGHWILLIGYVKQHDVLIVYTGRLGLLIVYS